MKQMRWVRGAVLILITQAANADGLLAEASQRIRSATLTVGAFKQEKRIKVLKKPLFSEGRFIFKDKAGVVWEIAVPMRTTIFIGPDRLVSEQGEQILPPAFGQVFNVLFSGDLQQLGKDFEVTGAVEATEWQLALRPRDEMIRKALTHIKLAGKDEVNRVEIIEANGNTTTIVFTELTHPQTLNATQDAEFERLSARR